jgi:hypothetical protein
VTVVFVLFLFFVFLLLVTVLCSYSWRVCEPIRLFSALCVHRVELDTKNVAFCCLWATGREWQVEVVF